MITLEDELELVEEANCREDDKLDSPFEEKACFYWKASTFSNNKSSERAELSTNAENEDVEDDTVLETGEDIPPQPKFQF